MHLQLTTHQVANELIADEFAGWSREEAFALAEYFENLEQECDLVIEFDRVLIRCTWDSYRTLEDIRKSHPSCPNTWDEAEEWLNDRTIFIRLEDSILLQQF